MMLPKPASYCTGTRARFMVILGLGVCNNAVCTAQFVESAGALKQLSFSSEKLAAIDRRAIEGGINLLQKPSTVKALA